MMVKMAPITHDTDLKQSGDLTVLSSDDLNFLFSGGSISFNNTDNPNYTLIITHGNDLKEGFTALETGLGYTIHYKRDGLN